MMKKEKDEVRKRHIQVRFDMQELNWILGGYDSINAAKTGSWEKRQGIDIENHREAL